MLKGNAGSEKAKGITQLPYSVYFTDFSETSQK
jgi:hypothetical protein